MLKLLYALKNNDGLTLKKGNPVSFKTGYQVADYGVEVRTPEAAALVIEQMEGNCGVWLSEGIYYIDHSFRVKTKKDALSIGRAHKQISVLQWKTMKLIYC